jgi:signal transduction histidine kinase
VVSMPLQERPWFKPAVVSVFVLVLALAIVASERAFKLARAIAALGRVHDELRQINEGLEKRVRERTEQLRDEIGERQKSKIQLAAVLAERNRLAGELHDTLEQGMTSISLQLESVARQLAKAPETARKHLDLARTLIRQSQAEARSSVWDLRSHLLESEDLAAAFAAIGHQMTEGTPVQISVDVQGAVQRLPELTENQLFRIGQEAITNALKHARCRHISVVLSYEPDSVTLGVADDGCGFEPHEPTHTNNGHFGMLGMRERAQRLGGRLRVESKPGNGTKISVQAPLSTGTHTPPK